MTSSMSAPNQQAAVPPHGTDRTSNLPPPPPPPLPTTSNHASDRSTSVQPQPHQQVQQSTTSHPEPLKPHPKFYLDITLGLTVLAHLLETTLHAVVAIFGIGVGVGLILGDSFRSNIPAVTLTVDGTGRSSNNLAATAAAAAAAAATVSTAVPSNPSTSSRQSQRFDTSNNLPPQ